MAGEEGNAKTDAVTCTLAASSAVKVNEYTNEAGKKFLSVDGNNGSSLVIGGTSLGENYVMGTIPEGAQLKTGLISNSALSKLVPDVFKEIPSDNDKAVNIVAKTMKNLGISCTGTDAKPVVPVFRQSDITNMDKNRGTRVVIGY